MVSNKLSVFAAAAALSQVALAGNPHQMLHGRAHMEDKRAVVVHTVVQTVYVNAAAPTAVVNAPVTEEVVPEAVVEAPVVEEKKKTVVKPKTTSHSTSGSSGIATKRGVTYRYADYGIPFLNKCEKCSWVHNWDSTANGDIGDATFIPTMWGEKKDHIDKWEANKKQALNSGLKTFFSFNEPDLLPEYADGNIAIRMEPDYAVTAHSKYFSGMPDDAYVAAPSITNGDRDGIDTGLDWLKKFVSGCNANSECRFDFCNIHWYSEIEYEATLYDHVKNAYDVCNEGNTGAKKKVWLTEFKTNDGTPEQKASWLRDTAIPKLEAIDELEAYSYFMADPTEMMVSPEVLKADGTAFASA